MAEVVSLIAWRDVAKDDVGIRQRYLRDEELEMLGLFRAIDCLSERSAILDALRMMAGAVDFDDRGWLLPSS